MRGHSRSRRRTKKKKKAYTKHKDPHQSPVISLTELMLGLMSVF